MKDITSKRRIYVASSWRNLTQPTVIERLKSLGHMVYDFRNPCSSNYGFHWSEIDPTWQEWTPEQYRSALDHPIAKRGFALDFDAMKWADTFVLVLPCGSSSHLELGWACGKGKKTLVLLNIAEPELMVKMADHICVSLDEVCKVLAG